MPVAGDSGEAGLTLIELVIAMALALVVTLGAFSFLEFSSSDVARITERVHSTQAGRIVMERLMLELHSACVAPQVAPVLEGSGESKLRFISAGGTEANLPSVELHEVIFTAPAGANPGSLVERTWPALAVSGSDPPRFSAEESTTPSTQLLLRGVRASEEGGGPALPVFRYYRYYRKGDSSPSFGQLDPQALGALGAEARDAVKVTIAFTVAPEGRLPLGLHDDRPVLLEDSAILRLVPTSESASVPNLPCSS